MSSKLNKAITETGKHAAIYGIGGIAPQIIGFILLPVFAHFLSPEEFGIWALLQSLSTVSVSVFTLGLDTACMRSFFDSEEPEKKRTIIGSTLLLLAVISLIINAAGLKAAPFFSGILFNSLAFSKHIQIIFLIVTFHIFNSLPYVIFRAKKHSLPFITIQSSLAVLRLLLMGSVLIAFDSGVLELLYIDLAVSASAFTALYIYIRRDIRLTVDFSEIKKLVSFGIPLVPGRFFNDIINFSDRYLLSYFLSLATVGVYSVSVKISQIVPLILGRPFQLIFPAIAFELHGEEHAENYFARVLTYFAYIGAFLCLSISLFSEELIYFIGSEKYGKAAGIIPILLLSFFLAGTQQIIRITVFTHRKTYWVAVVMAAGSFFNIVCNVVLIPLFGLFGSAFSRLMTESLMLGIYYFISTRYQKIRYEWTRLFKIFSLSFAIFVLSRIYPQGNIYSLALFKLIALMSFPFVLYLWNFYHQEEIKKLSGIYRTVTRQSHGAKVKFDKETEFTHGE